MLSWRLIRRAPALFNARLLYEDSGPNASSAEGGISQVPAEVDGFEKLKHRNLMSQLDEAINFGRNQAAIDLLPTLNTYEMLTTASCNEFLHRCSLSGNDQVAKSIMTFMEENGLEKTESSYGNLLGATCRSGNLDEALEMLTSLMDQNNPSLRNENGAHLSYIFNTVLAGIASMGSNTHAEKCLSLMESKGILKTQQTYAALIRLAGKNGDLSLIRNLWSQLKADSAPNINSYRAYIIALCRGNDLNEALVVLQDMLDHVAASLKLSDTIPAAVTETFNAIIHAASRAGQYELAETLFAEMNRTEIPVSLVTYDALIEAVVKGRGVDYGIKLLEKMESSGIEPDSKIYGAIVDGYCKRSQLDKAERLLEQMLKAKSSQRPTAHTFNFILQTCSLTDDQDRALRVLRRMKSEGIPPDICTYTALFCLFGNVSFPYSRSDQTSQEELDKRIRTLEMDMMSSGVQHSRQSLTSLMRGLGAENMLGPAMKRLISAEAVFAADGSPFVDAFAYNTAIYACAMSKQFGEAKDIFNRMSSKGVKPNLHTYNIMIFGCSKTKDVKYAYELLDSLKANEIVADSITYNSLIKVVCACNEPEAALEIIQTMDRAGIQADIRSFNTIISAATTRGRIDMIEFILEDLNDRKIPPNSYTILKVMLTYIRLKRLDDAIQVVRDLSARMLEAKTKEGGKINVQDAVQVLMEDTDQAVTNMTESLARTVEQSSDPAAEALFTLSVAGLAADSKQEEDWSMK